VPAYNEEKIIGDTIIRLYSFMKSMGGSFELIIANDGSRDRTPKIVVENMSKCPELRIVSNEKNLGRGAVLTKAFNSARGEVCIYIDADLAIDLELFPRLMSAIEQGADIAIGSKHLPGSQVEYPFLRRLASKGYAFLSGLLLKSSVWDFQCGFKAFRKSVLDHVLPHIKEEGWSWDTEILVKSEWMGYKITELPARVINIYRGESKVHLFRDIKRMGYSLFRLWREKNAVETRLLFESSLRSVRKI
jgi:glycosyltransferase involved in cell wall biosynthesis